MTSSVTVEKQFQIEDDMDWRDVVAAFALDAAYIPLGTSQFLASHPLKVREAIDHYREALDKDPVGYTLDHERTAMQAARESLNRYFGVGDADDIAMTDSTTMGLGILYTALNPRPGQEILLTDHDHYSHYEAVYQVCQRTGARWRKVKLYDDLQRVTSEQLISAVVDSIGDDTRLLGLTWVQSDTGLKMPVAEMCAAVHEINRARDGDHQVKTIIDGVHGFGIELDTFRTLSCDFFVASGHKWLYGPRGTGFVAGRHDAWQLCSPVIPSYTEAMEKITEGERPVFMDGKQMTPGGFHSLEYRWALPAAVDFILAIGKQRIYDRVHALNRQCKEGLCHIPHVRLITPLDDALSAGIIAFEVEGLTADEVVSRLRAQNIIATASPYKHPYARFTPGIINTPLDIDKALDAVKKLQ